MNAKDLQGRVFGKLTVIAFAGSRLDPSGDKRRFWQCECQCGEKREVMATALLNGNSTSCGCFRIEAITTHGDSKSPEHRAWISMSSRCSNQNLKRFEDYGGRGITVCSRWKVYENFISDMGRRPSRDHSLDRVNNEGNYEPGNCRWATRSEQQSNKRTSKKYANVNS